MYQLVTFRKPIPQEINTLLSCKVNVKNLDTIYEI